MIVRDSACPLLDCRALDLDGGPALAAYQMVVVLATLTAPVELFPVRRPHVIDLARVDEQLQCAVHGRQADRHATVPQLGMKLLGAPEFLSGGQQNKHFGALARLTRDSPRGPAH
jgi:hypothetical protein